MNHCFSSLVKQSLSRATEATLSMSGIVHPGLREHLSKQMNAECGKPGSFLAEPLFEQTFGWSHANKTMQQLVEEGLLSKALVESLDSKSNERYRFGADWKPFTHQLTSWQALLERKNSIVVTSGTGSGKTECFMVPVLEDLQQLYEQNGRQPLEGVHALFLYPLNALINSQRERLDAWTQAFGHGIRYCLYNGNTPEAASNLVARQRLHPNEVLTRETLREHPAPILVTNGTMLEYMMVRQVDAPILEKSRAGKTLRWIVLDEAHSYIGSQAAELAMQLRRVMRAFGVTPEEVRFVATSATIAGDDAAEQLKTFLSDLSGVPKHRIEVLDGKRAIPQLCASLNQPVDLKRLQSMEPEDSKQPEVLPERYELLLHSPEARALRFCLENSRAPLKLGELVASVAAQVGHKLTQDELLGWLDVCTATKRDKDSESFLKVRAHFFQRTTQGLWACINPNCSCKTGTPLEKNWPFGRVYTSQRQRCECGALVFELSFCNECNEPHLLAIEKNNKLIHWDVSNEDEFSLSEQSEDFDDTQVQSETQIGAHLTPTVLSGRLHASKSYNPTQIDRQTGKTGLPGSDSDSVSLFISNDSSPCCSAADCEWSGRNGSFPFRRALLGGPFYVANAVPTVLEYCPDFDDDDSKLSAQSLAGRGRRLITFTDSRQGTARISARISVRMQQEAERSRLRGMVVNELCQKQAGAKPEWQTTADDLRSKGVPEDVIQQAVNSMKDKQLNEGRRSVAIAWKDLVNELVNKADLSGPMLLQNRYQKPEIFGDNTGPHVLAEMLLFREFMRRPKRQNSLETQGLVAVGYEGLERVTDKLPMGWEAKGLTKQDWNNFLKVCLDFFIRENTFVQLNDQWRNWIGNRFASKSLRSPDSKEATDSRIKLWPLIRNGNYHQRIIKLLLLGAQLNPESKTSQDLVNDWLKEAWKSLIGANGILKSDENRHFLVKEKLTFSLMTEAWVCPITHKLIDTTFRGFTPYLPQRLDFSQLTDEQRARFRCRKTDLPKLWKFDRSEDDHAKGVAKIRSMVAEDPQIAALRSENLWTDINDRAVEGGFYYRTAEHSAQQSAERLGSYEERFKEGKINVLNCSTTMEMGVDIGGISAVVMNNVPPHPANYLQRAGRAGRSKESRALAYTLCKGNAHDQQVFAEPLWPFKTKIPAPAVALSSERLVQRHVNGVLLSHFLCNTLGPTQKDKHLLTTGWFFGKTEEGALCERFIDLLKGSGDTELDRTLESAVKYTGLHGRKAHQLRQDAAESIQGLLERWARVFEYLSNEANTAKPKSPYAKRVAVELKRHTGEYLLRDLAARTFLPGYGFPTDVVSFDNFTIEDYLQVKKQTEQKKDREDNISRYKGLPSRNLAVAIREYAPGAEIVLDGRVFRSAGISLHWHNLIADTNEAQKFDLAWRCHNCGELGYEEDMHNTASLVCSNQLCGAEIKQENIKKVLVPAGFVTDAYESTSNNIEHQKYIPVQQPWVIIKSAPEIALPDPALGFMRAGPDGMVFHHSDGEFTTGFAVCMQCGRAHSMDKSGEFPKELNPRKSHRSPRPSKEDRYEENGQRRLADCGGQGALQQNITLGAYSRTDVFELVLRHPVSNEYLIDEGKESTNRSVALTLAVALRFALASKLGISASELGFGTRPTKIENQSVLVIQLYDELSGGAGFASSAPEYIADLLQDMVKRLQCSHCETACNECLLDSTTRHYQDKLDHKAALAWLGKDFIHRIKLPETAPLVASGNYHPKYQPLSVEAVIRKAIRQGAHHLVLRVTGEEADWDLSARAFKHALQTYRLIDGITVDLLLPPAIVQPEIQEDLLTLQAIGVRLGVSTEAIEDVVIAQLVYSDQVKTIASNEAILSVPGSCWHQSGGLAVTTDHYPLLNTLELDTSSWLGAGVQMESKHTSNIEIKGEFDGNLRSFGERFWVYLQEHISGLEEILSHEGQTVESITYSDRYLQCPSNILLLTSLLAPVASKLAGDSKVSLKTLFKEKFRRGYKMFHDWDEQWHFESFTKAWVSNQHRTDLDLKVVNTNRDIPHHRKLEIKFSSGTLVRIRFDQGVGYWRLDGRTHYDFSENTETLVEKVNLAMTTLKVRHGESWPTDISVELKRH